VGRGDEDGVSGHMGAIRMARRATEINIWFKRTIDKGFMRELGDPPLREFVSSTTKEVPVIFQVRLVNMKLLVKLFLSFFQFTAAVAILELMFLEWKKYPRPGFAKIVWVGPKSPTPTN